MLTNRKKNMEIKLEPVAQDIEGGWLLFRLTSVEVSVTISPKNYESRKVTATLEAPESHPIMVSMPLFPGTGTQPENTISRQNIEDQVQLILQNLENAIETNIKKEDTKESGW